MPELPEVETIARTLTPCIQHRIISGVTLLNPGTLQGPLPLERVEQATITGVRRRGKLLLWDLAHAMSTGIEPGMITDSDTLVGLAFHLKMSGRVFAYPAQTQPGTHTRAIFDLDDGQRIFFDDARKFGLIRVLTPSTLADWPFWNKLGPEPFALDPQAFARLFAGKRGQMKALLLNQSVLAGVGNIYADESLFRAGINPATPAHKVSAPQLQSLHRQLLDVLNESINACGSSIRDYRTARGDAGAFQNAFCVYGRAGKPCTVCANLLAISRVAGRTTVFCPKCQPLDNF